MNLIGKIFVFAVFIMSLVLMTFATAIYLSHTNWKDTVERPPEQVSGGKPLGLKYQLQEAEQEREKLDREIKELTAKVAASEASRDQVVAKLQTAIVDKSTELDVLRAEKEKRQNDVQNLADELKDAKEALQRVTADAERLRGDVRAQQKIVDEQVDRAASLAAQLEEQKAFLAVANERKAQLERQVANARMLLQQSGLAVDSPPRDRVPKLDGDVIAVAEGAIEISLGGDDGLQVGHTLEVYRGDQYVGRAVVRAVRPDHAIAEPVREYMRGVVQRGDKVTTRLKA
ncbi:MAG: hypothetical protein EBS51_01505 [Planctomycetia bacterium]|jgi:hypothetical protein|nr:hypothetical protein [Planctomycetia bacterium]